MMMMTGDVDLDAVTMAVTDLADLATMEDLAVLVVLAMAVGDGNIQPSITNKRGCHIGAHAFLCSRLQMIIFLPNFATGIIVPS